MAYTPPDIRTLSDHDALARLMKMPLDLGDSASAVAELLADRPGLARAKKQQFDGLTLASAAAKAGNIQMLRLVAPISDLNDARGGQLTPLMRAIEAGHEECALFLIDLCDPAVAVGSKGSSRQSLGRQGATALIMAAERGLIECLAKLLPRSDPRAVNALGVNALMSAARHSRPRCVAALASLCDPRARSAAGDTALMWAASSGVSQNVELLLPLSDPLAANALGNTALLLAAKNGHADCVERLLPVSDARAVGEEGFDALMAAAAQGHADCVRILLPHSDPRALNRSGRAAIDYCFSIRHASSECFDMLVRLSDLSPDHGRDKIVLATARSARRSGSRSWEAVESAIERDELERLAPASIAPSGARLRI